ncbi:MAG: HRDC domain-containing protein [Gammaproteobacteria bacterium]|nr:HRDC domain-containing protein [Gammaproteobacteria bacterium]
MSIPNLEYKWITTTDELKALSTQWETGGFLCVDTEFHREKTFYPQLALLQVNSDGQNFLIEPDIAKQTPKFLALFSNASITKVFHSASEDCEVLYRALGIKISSLFDTQIAAAYLGSRNGIGYAALVTELTGTELAKGETRSDWMIRPLSNQQEVYAAADVHYLRDIFIAQQKLIQQQPHLIAWIDEDSDATAQRVDDLDNIEDAYLDIKNGWKLNKQQLIRLNALCQWREKIARQSDRPKPFVLRNEVIFELAEKGLVEKGGVEKERADNSRVGDSSKESVSKLSLPFIKGWHPASLRRHGTALLELLAQLDYEQDELTQPLSPEFWQKLTAKMQNIKAAIEQVANQLNIPSDVICSRKLQRQYVAYLLNDKNQKPRGWTKSREQHIGPVIKSVIE